MINLTKRLTKEAWLVEVILLVLMQTTYKNSNTSISRKLFEGKVRSQNYIVNRREKTVQIKWSL